MSNFFHDESYIVFGKPYKINEHITIRNPYVQEIIDMGEERYYRLVSALTALPQDYKAQLDDAGINFYEFPDFDMFYMLIKSWEVEDTKILFGEKLDFTKMEYRFHQDEKNPYVYIGYEDEETGDEIVIDNLVRIAIRNFIKAINGISINDDEKEIYNNDYAIRWAIQKARDELRVLKYKKNTFKSILTPMISTLANIDEGNHTYKSLQESRLSQVQESLRRVIMNRHYNEVMMGIYTGNIDPKTIDLKKISFFL